MARKTAKSQNRFIDKEIGTLHKNTGGCIKVALGYPNRYHVGMSNLGFQSTYRLFNEIEHVACERFFLPENDHQATGRITTIESRTPIIEFDIIAFSVSFENDYPNILALLEKAGLPLQSNDRGTPHPLVIAGGVACFLNPEPISPYIDLFLIGEAKEMLFRFFEFFEPGTTKKSYLQVLAQNVQGAYVPAFYNPSYQNDGTIASYKPVCDVPEKIICPFVKDLSAESTFSTIITPDTTFDRTFLIEVGRGCPHGCRFCTAGFIYRPPRFRPIELLKENMNQGIEMTNRIGLVGAAVSDLPGIGNLCKQALKKDIRISFSSLRADALTPELLSVLSKSKIKTATIAPDAGSERLRSVINKGITKEDILAAVETLVENDILNLKLYFMIGLPTETMDDVEEITELCKRIKHSFLKFSRPKKRMGEITVSLSSFVPKPFTPFQWCAMDDVSTLKKKIKKIKTGLKSVANIRVNADIPRWAYIQALLSRGDRKVAKILSSAYKAGGNWAQTLKESPLNPDFYVLRERSLDELFPWDFIDHGISKSFLKKEYKKGMQAKTSPPCPMELC
ncbi:MAG: TIGR03960 family B12-binding radical SAM protein, partial [Deltaproteobacteria bacterium]|nr:TIGR03960 family B12-binding radical SAM protein [Deltaproteobacteria bacterium]